MQYNNNILSCCKTKESNGSTTSSSLAGVYFHHLGNKMKKIDRLHGKLVPSRVALLLLLGLEVLFLQSINASRSSSAIGSVNSFNRRLHPHSSLSPSSSSASVLSPSLVELRLRYYYGQKIGNLRGGNIVNTNSSANSSANSSIEDNGKDDEESNVYHDVLHKTDEKALQHELSLHDESTLYVNTENKSKTISSSCSSINSSTSSTNNNNKNNNSSSKAQTNKMSKIQNAIERVIPAIIMLILFQQLITHTGETGLYILIPLMQFKMYKETTGIIEEYYKLKYQRKQIMVRRHGDNDPKEEVAVVVERGNNFDLKVNIEKWWWFMTIFVTTTGRFLRSEIICRLSPSMLKNKGETSILPLSSSVSSSSSPMIMILDQLYSIIENEHKFNLVVYGMVSIGLIMAVVGMASHVDASADKFRSYLGEVASFHFALVSFPTMNNLVIHDYYHTSYTVLVFVPNSISNIFFIPKLHSSSTLTFRYS